MKSASMFLFIFLLSGYSFAAKEVVDKVIATVNTEPILLSDLKNLQSRLPKEGSVDETLLLGEKADSLKNNRQAQLEYLIREKLIASEIKKQGLGISNDRVEAEMTQMSRRAQMAPAEFSKYVQKQGYTLEQYKELLKSRIERQSFFESEIVSKLRITDEDAYGEYQTKNPNYLPNVNEYAVAQIFFDPQKGGPESALKRAQAAIEKLRSGESFETIANRDSEDKANKDGFLGTFKTGEFNPIIENAVSSLAVGDHTGIVKSKQGYHVFKLLSKKTTLDPQFLKYKEAIKASLIEKNFARQLKNWFESKRQDAYVKIFETTT